MAALGTILGGLFMVGLTGLVAITMAATAVFVPGTSIYGVPKVAPSVESAQHQLAPYTDEAITASDVIDYCACIPLASGLLAPGMDASLKEGVVKLDDKLDTTEESVYVMGFSQGAAVIAIRLQQHVSGEDTITQSPDNLTFILIGNPARNNGGILGRLSGGTIPFFDIPFGVYTPQTEYKTIDVAKQYDGFADFPKYPLNLLATANAIMGIVYLHPVYDVDVNDPNNYVQVVGNTTYVTIPTEHLPLLQPLRDLDNLTGGALKPVLDAIEPGLKAIIETAYDRSDYSKPTPAALLPTSQLVEPKQQEMTDLNTVSDEPEVQDESSNEEVSPNTRMGNDEISVSSSTAQPLKQELGASMSDSELGNDDAAPQETPKAITEETQESVSNDGSASIEPANDTGIQKRNTWQGGSSLKLSVTRSHFSNHKDQSTENKRETVAATSPARSSDSSSSDDKPSDSNSSAQQ